jgi:hypothetical protein
MADLRRMFYNRYKSSNIFNREMPQINPIINKNTAREINKKKDTFIPKYNKMTSKERYWHEMRYKEFGHSNNENKDMNNIDTKSNKNSSKQFKRNHSIKDSRRRSEYEKQNNLNGVDIMCKHMFNGYDPKKYKMKRSKSLYDLRSYSSDLPINEKSSRQERNLAYTGSNIFFDKSKDLQIKQSYNKFKKNKSSTNLNDILSKSFKRQKSMSDFERELNERKSKFSHSKYTTDMDWKTTNTEDMHYDSESDYVSVFSDNGVKKKSFRRVNILKREITGDVNNKNKNREQVKESVKYNILTGKDKKDAISDKIYNKYDNNNNNKLKKNYSKKKYDYKTNNNNDKYQTNIEYYEIDIPRNYDLTDINTIRNYFTNKGLHAFKIEESANTYTNQSGKITLRIRRDNVIDDKEYNKNIDSVKKLISKNGMKLDKIEGNKAKASTIAKLRVKTPYKGEVMLKPCNTKDEYKNIKIKNENNSKANANQSKRSSAKKINKTPGKKKKLV